MDHDGPMSLPGLQGCGTAGMTGACCAPCSGWAPLSTSSWWTGAIWKASPVCLARQSAGESWPCALNIRCAVSGGQAKPLASSATFSGANEAQRLRQAGLPQVAADCKAGPRVLEPDLPAASEDHGGAACPKTFEPPHIFRATISFSRLQTTCSRSPHWHLTYRVRVWGGTCCPCMLPTVSLDSFSFETQQSAAQKGC